MSEVITMQGNIIIVPDKSKADELVAVGFKYTLRKISDNKTVYQFMRTPELEKYLKGNFSKQEFFINNCLTF